MANKILIKKSSTAAATPTVGQLDAGELAINTADGRLFAKNAANAVVNLPVSSISGQAITPSSVQTSGTADGIKIQAGGTANSRVITLQPTALGGNRTLTLPDATADVAVTYNGAGVIAGITANQKIGTLRNNLGDPSVEEMALFHGQFTNKFRFLAPTLQEHSANGTTWTTSTRMSVSALGDLMIGEGQGTAVDVIPPNTVGEYGGYRLTWDVVAQTGYVFLNFLYIYSCACGNNIACKIEKYNPLNDAWSTLHTGTIQNYPGHTSIKHDTIAYHPSLIAPTTYNKVRVTFESTHNANTNGFTLHAIEWFGGYPGAQRRNAESYDRLKNVTFPADITATAKLQSTYLMCTTGTGTAPIFVSSTTRCNNLNADSVDGYHNTDFFRKDTNTWQNTADGIGRFYFSANSRSYYKSGDGHEFRNGVDTNIFTIDNAGNAAAVGAITGRNVRNKTYNSSDGVANGWYPIFNIGTSHTVEVNICTQYHGSCLAVISTNYLAGYINVLNAAVQQDGFFRNIAGIRLLSTGAVEIQLNGTPANFTDVSVELRGCGIRVPTLAAALVQNTAAVTVFNSVTLVHKQTVLSGLSVTGASLTSTSATVGTAGGTRIAISGLGGSNAVSEYFSAEANPRWVLGRDVIGSGLSGLGFGIGSSTVAAGGVGIGYAAAREMGFYTSNATSLIEHMRLDNAGYLGIGTNDPQDRLHLNGAQTTMRLQSSTAYDTQFRFIDTTSDWSFGINVTNTLGNGVFGIRSNTAAAHRLVIDATGRVGIANAVPYARLNVGAKVIDDASYTYDTHSLVVTHQTATSTSVLNDSKEVLLLARQGTGGQAYGAAASFQLSRYENSSVNSRTRLDLVLGHTSFMSSPTTVLTARSDGNVGIGNAAPGSRLVVKGEGVTSATSALNVTNSANASLLSVRNDGLTTVIGQISSTLAVGTAPLAVTSTTVCTNLNADTVDGQHASAFATSAHTHGSITNDGKIGSTTGQVITTGSAGVLQASATLPAANLPAPQRLSSYCSGLFFG